MKEWNVPKFLVISTTFGYFFLLVFLCFSPIPVASKDVLTVQIGVVGMAWGGIIGYWFGSSDGSKRKTEMLGQPTTATTTDIPAGTVKTVTAPQKKDGE